MIRIPFASTCLALSGLLLAAPTMAQQNNEAADRAWENGDYVRAEELYSARLASDSSDIRALHRMALILAWGEHYERSLGLFQRLLAMRPEDPNAAVDRARVLAWQHEHRRAIAAVDSVLERDPGHLEALRARAQFQAWAGDHTDALETYERILAVDPGDDATRRQQAQALSWNARYDEAAAAYRTLLARDPTDLEALRGLARTSSWSGDLAAGEAWWRKALALAPADIESLIGLSQTLRWQSRHADARAVQRQAGAVAPDHPDLRDEMRWTRAALAPRFSPTFVLESDSDGNRISTTNLVVAAHLTSRLELRGDFYYRELGQRILTGFDRSTRGGQASLTLRTAPGWTLSAGAGASAGGAAEGALGTYRAAVHSPPRSVHAGLEYSRRRFDVTAELAANRVAVEELALTTAAGSSRAWLLETRASAAEFIGEVRNRRLYGRAELGHPIARDFRLSGAVTAFGFRDEVVEGYFNPDFYGLAELNTRWSREAGSWHFLLEAAPGVQQVGSDGDGKGAFRASGRVAFTIAPGRQIGITAAHSSNGMQRVATGDADYRYRALIISGGWAF